MTPLGIAVVATLTASITTLLWTLVLERNRRRREDQTALGNASLLILHFSQWKGRLSNIAPMDAAREEWRLLTEIAKAILPIRSEKFLPLAAETAYFVIDRSLASFSEEEAVALFRKLSKASNRKLVEKYDEHKARLNEAKKA